MEWLVLLGLAGAAGYVAYRHGKQLGSRKGYGVALDHARRGR